MTLYGVLKKIYKAILPAKSRILYDRLRVFIDHTWYRFLIKSRPSFYRAVTEIIERSQSRGVQYADLWYLYSTVKKKEPECILEFGTGVSTVALAQAVRELEQENNKRPVLYSVEDHPDWYQHQLDIFPAELKGYVNFLNRPVEKIHEAGIDMVEFKDIPDEKYDFIFLDGPSSQYGSQTVKNVIDILKRSEQDIEVVIDTRLKPTREIFARIDQERYMLKTTFVSILNIIKSKKSGK